jgi:hypothetical protein
MIPTNHRSSFLLPTLLVGLLAMTNLGFAPGQTPPGQAKKNPPPPPAPVATAYSGSATALRIDDVEIPIPGPLIHAATGELPTTGGSLQASEENYVLYGTDGVTVALGFDAAFASTVGAGTSTESDASLTGFQVRFDTPARQRVTILADYIAASAEAHVVADGSATASGSISITNLTINGAVVTVTGEPNQTVLVPGGYIVFNEQTVVIGNGDADIMITAMHVYIDGCMNGAFGIVKAGITAGSTPPPEEKPCGKLTGGGWIVGPSGAKATFGVSGGIRRGEYWGHLTYNDHGAGLKVKSTRVIGYQPNPRVPDCRIITFEVEINGVPGTATVDAWDRGEPGRNDFFSISLSTGYRARGTLGGDGPGGGNLQLHKCPPGWAK